MKTLILERIYDPEIEAAFGVDAGYTTQHRMSGDLTKDQISHFSGAGGFGTIRPDTENGEIIYFGTQRNRKFLRDYTRREGIELVERKVLAMDADWKDDEFYRPSSYAKPKI